MLDDILDGTPRWDRRGDLERWVEVCTEAYGALRAGIERPPDESTSRFIQWARHERERCRAERSGAASSVMRQLSCVPSVAIQLGNGISSSRERPMTYGS